MFKWHPNLITCDLCELYVSILFTMQYPCCLVRMTEFLDKFHVTIHVTIWGSEWHYTVTILGYEWLSYSSSQWVFMVGWGKMMFWSNKRKYLQYVSTLLWLLTRYWMKNVDMNSGIIRKANYFASASIKFYMNRKSLNFARKTADALHGSFATIVTGPVCPCHWTNVLLHMFVY